MKKANAKTDLSRLNARQKEAVVSEEKRILVLAGAGSGKTKTLLQKIVYLINDKKVKPSQILAITFTKNAANEMLDRLIISADTSGAYEKLIFDKNLSQEEKNAARLQFSRTYKWIGRLTCKTFHSLCYSALRNYGVNEFDNKFKVIGDKKLASAQNEKFAAAETDFEVLHKILIESCDNTKYLLKLKRFILDYYIDKIQLESSPHFGQYYDGKFYTSLKGDRVKSKSERDIADWLYRHSIPYQYEPKINIKDFNFRPDFYIPQANLYLEHVSSRSYSMKNKEEQFQKGNKTLVKTFESMTRDTALFNRALERIVKGRLSANYEMEAALSFEEEFKYYHEDVKTFCRQVLRVIDMVKVENLKFAEIYKKSQKDPHERIREFYQLAKPLFKQYNAYCTNRSYLDFNDMIIRTTALLKHQPEIREKFHKQYRYILVDEFQDVNSLQVELLNYLLTEETQLFCVGDDWQSIYGFRGSEVDYIINFNTYFENAKLIKLNLNYRSANNIVDASNEVIKHNKYKVDKVIKASRKSKSKINIYAANSEEDAVTYFIDVVKSQIEGGQNPEEIMVLYRRSKMFYPYRKKLKEENIHIQGKTIHAAKGLEANVVFIIGLTEGYGGFPDIWLDDRIYQVIKKAKHDLMLEEERRLFYVALTRAKESLYLITEKGNESSFLNEIPDKYAISFKSSFQPFVDKITLCPKCQIQLDDDYNFCPHCGIKLDAAVQTPN